MLGTERRATPLLMLAGRLSYLSPKGDIAPTFVDPKETYPAISGVLVIFQGYPLIQKILMNLKY